MKRETKDKTLITTDLIHPNVVVMDIVYNPRVTKLLKETEKAGAKTIEGISMLVYQGAEQFEIFTGRKAPIEIMRNALLVALDEISS